jgi:hypothetical protein
MNRRRKKINEIECPVPNISLSSIREQKREKKGMKKMNKYI